MKRTIITYLKFIGIYFLLFTFFEFAPFLIDFNLAAGISFLGMLAVFMISRKRNNNYQDPTFYITNLAFIFLFSVITIIFDQTTGLTTITPVDEQTVSLTNSTFYERTLAINHAILLSTVVLTIYSLISRQWKNLALCGVTIVVLLGYISLVA